MTPGDLRTAARTLARTPVLTVALLASLAFGAGANAMLFTLTGALLFRIPAVAAPASLVSIHTGEYGGNAYGSSSYPDFLAMAASSGPFQALAASDETAFRSVKLAEGLKEVRIAAVSDEFFNTLGLVPHLGRLLAAEDRAAGNAVVVSFRLWTELGGDASVLDRTLTIDGRDYAIVGVAPSDFVGLSLQRECEAWVPLPPDEALADRSARVLAVVARLHHGATLDSLNRLLSRLASDLADAHPRSNRGTRAAVQEPRRFTAVAYSRLDPAVAPRVRTIGAVILGSALLLLVGACVNAGGLLLSQAVARRQQFAVQVLLGATRGRLIRQVLAESVLLAMGSAALGLVVAGWTAAAVPPLFAPEHARFLDTTLAPSTIATTMAVAALVACGFAIGPAVYAARAQAVSVVRGDPGGVSDRSGAFWIRGLVVAQVSLSTLLVAVCGGLWSAMHASLTTDTGAPASQVAVAAVQLTFNRNDEVGGRRKQEWADRSVKSVPGVAAVAWSTAIPMTRENRRRYTLADEDGFTRDTVEPEVSLVSPNYFEVLGLTLVDGRPFHDWRRQPVVIVSERFAREYFRDRAVGQFLIDHRGRRFEIIGVVQSPRHRTLQEEPRPMVYHPMTWEYVALVNIIVRMDDGVAPPIEPLRVAIRPWVDIVGLETLESHLSRLAFDRLITTVVAVSSALALLLAALGVYGVMNDAVRRRRREIGLRMALGARPVQIGRVVLAEALGLTTAGLAVGLATQTALTHALAGGAFPFIDATTLTATLTLLAAIVAIAAVLPMRRALSVHPALTLRA